MKAAHRSAAIACGARPVPFRTRKLSRTAPMVLRGKPVGEQGAADRWTAFRSGRPPRETAGASSRLGGAAPAPALWVSAWKLFQSAGSLQSDLWERNVL